MRGLLDLLAELGARLVFRDLEGARVLAGLFGQDRGGGVFCVNLAVDDSPQDLTHAPHHY